MARRRTHSLGIRSLRRAAALLLGCVLALGFPGDGAAKKDKDKDRKQYTVGESMHEKLTQAQEAFAEDDIAQAREVLQALEKRSKRFNPYERALVYLFLAHADAMDDRYDEALANFEKCLAEDALPPTQQLNTRFNVAQLYLASERFQDAIRTLELWFAETETPSAIAYYLLAVAHYQVGDVEGAIPPARESVARSETPQESWIHLLVAVLFETKRYEEAIEPLELLVTLYPKKEYWTQLSALYHHLGREPQSLAAMQIAYQEGFLEKGHEYRQLALLLLHANLPYRAAKVLDKGLADGIVEGDAANWELLANSWLLARENERALEPLRHAAGLAESGDLYVRLGQVYLERERWADASASLAQAFQKGGLGDVGTANLLMGIALYHQERLDRARSHFDAALDDASTRDSASTWIQLLERETGSG